MSNTQIFISIWCISDGNTYEVVEGTTAFLITLFADCFSKLKAIIIFAI